MSEVGVPPAAAPAGVKVLHGSDGYLFLTGDGNRLVDQIEGRYPFTAELGERIRRVQARRRHMLRLHGIRYAHLVAPNKETVFEHLLPEDIVPRRDGPTPIERFRATYPDTLFFEPGILRGEHAAPTYYKLDTHWTHFAASLYLVRALRETIARRLDFDAALSRLVAETKPRWGDLGSKIGAPREEITEFVSPSKAASLVYFNEVRNTGAVRLYRNPDALYVRRVLFLHDSFGIFTIDLAIELFREVVFIHSPDLDPDCIVACGFDTVICVQAERFFVRCPSNKISYRQFVERLEQDQRQRATFDDFLAALGPKSEPTGPPPQVGESPAG